METSLMSESLRVDSSDVEETVTQVLTQFVQDGGDEDQMSEDGDYLLQGQVRVNAYARQYVSRSVHGGDPGTRTGNGGAGGSY